MKKQLLLKPLLTLALVMICGSAWGAATYKLVPVTTVDARNSYVFEQDGHVMINTVNSSALQTTNDYKTEGLAGNEVYVWKLTKATNGFYISSVASNKYISNTSGTNVSLGTSGSDFTFSFTDDGVALISNSSNSDRFLGYTSTASYAYKAYAKTNLSSGDYPHAIKVYKLVVKEGTGVDVTGVSLQEKLELGIGNTTTLEATITPSDATNKNVTWSSSNESVAKIDENGVVKGIATGTATITVTTEDGEFTASCSVTVKEFLVVTYDFHAADSYPSDFPTEGGTNAADATTFTIDGGSIIIKAPTAYYIINSKTDESRALFFGKSTTSVSSCYLGFPGKSNYKLNKVVMTTSSSIAGGVSLNIFDTTGKAMSTALSTTSSKSEDLSFVLNGSEENTEYRLATTTSNKNLQFFKAELFYEPCEADTREAPTASFTQTTINIVKGNTNTQTVNTNSDGTITYASSDASVATVNATTGEVTAVAAGKATITASIEATTTYKAAEASYTVQVTSEPLSGSGTKDDPYTVGDVKALGNASESWVTGTIVGYGTTVENSLSYTTEKNDFQESNIVISDNNGNICAVQLSAGTDVRTALNLKYNDFIGVIVKVKGTIEKYFNVPGVKSVTDYLLKQQSVSISNAGQASACVSFDAIISGAEAFYVNEVGGNVAKCAAVTGVIPAGTGVIVKTTDGNEGNATFTEAYKTKADEDAAENNMLKGSINGETFSDPGYTYYILSTGSNGVGFYWDASTNNEGKTANCAAGKAVLAVPGASSSNVIRIEGTTGIDTIEAAEEPIVIYDLTGRQVKAATNGIYIVNGKKMIIK